MLLDTSCQLVWTPMLSEEDKLETAAIIKPVALKKGDAIGVIVPAGPINRERFDRALERLRIRGFQLKFYGDIYRSSRYLAGDDDTRANELMAAFADPETAAVWCARGGYGVMRLLDRIDFNVIRQNPKVLVGFSDITALHTAINQRTGLVTFHGPNVQDGFGKPDDMPPANELALWQNLCGQAAADKSMNDASHANAQAAATYSYDLRVGDNVSPREIRGGIATGQLIGGNLAVLCGMLGTPFEIETEGRILFLEDIGERLYRIDRYLTQLRLAGKLNAVAGVLLGDFSYDSTDQREDPADIARFLQVFFSPLGVPILAGFPAGHEAINLTLPIGGLIELDADAGRVTLLESPVTPSTAM